jgi:hypothetical protein
LKQFLISEEGAVTVDWVIMTAGVVGLCFALYSTMSSSQAELLLKINGWMAAGEHCIGGATVISVGADGSVTNAC